MPITIIMPNGGVRTFVSEGSFGVRRKANKCSSHIYLGMHDRKEGKNYKVHRMVCEAFHGPPPFDGAVVIHLDENGLNNRPENLKWGTQKENMNMPKIKSWQKTRVGRDNPYLKGISKALLPL